MDVSESSTSAAHGLAPPPSPLPPPSPVRYQRKDTTPAVSTIPGMVLRHARPSLGVAAIAAGLLCLPLAPAPAAAQGASPAPAIEQQFSAAAQQGPAALLQALQQVLQREPALAATPERAVGLARAAGAPVGGFVGASLPVYRAITSRIADAAPPAARAAVRAAVAAELGRLAAQQTARGTAGQPNAGALAAEGPRRQAELDARGYRVGSFVIYPSIQAATVFDSNIYATRSQRRSDLLATVSPQVTVESDWARNALTATVQTDLTGYDRSPHENTADWNASIEGRIDATDTTRILLGGTAIASHEDRSSPDAVNGLTPTPYQEFNGYAGVIQRLGDFSVRVGGAIERTSFSNVDSAHGIINNQDRNRNRFTFGALVRYEANPGFRPFVEVLGDLRHYDDRVDDFGYARSSDGYRAGVGALFRFSPTLRGEAFLGVMGSKADDPRFRAVTTPSFDGNLHWQARPSTALVLFAERSLEETTLAGSPAYIATTVGGRVEQKLTDKLTGLIRLGWTNSDFLQSTRMDNDYDVSVGLRYALNARVTLGVDYRYTRRSSNVYLANYDRNTLYFRIGSSF